MFSESNTYESIMDEMLSSVDEGIDTREGSVMYEAVSGMAMEIAQLYADMDMTLEECFADTASYYYLIKKAAERGVFVRQGSAAVIKVKVTPTALSVPIGAVLNIGELNYSIYEDLGEGYYSIVCSEVGEQGNKTTDDVIPMEDIEGLESIIISEIITPGTDDEDVESLRNRYYNSFKELAFGGNKAEYKEKANEFTSVYGCKVYPTWNGGGTVKIVILGSGYKKATETVIANIQYAFDPDGDGSGTGIAPIGHTVTVDTVTETPINIACNVNYVEGYTWNDIKDSFSAAVDDYLLELRQTWEDSNDLVVRVGQIERILLGIQGVDDVVSISINSTSGNYSIAESSVPVGGDYSG